MIKIFINNEELQLYPNKNMNITDIINLLKCKNKNNINIDEIVDYIYTKSLLCDIDGLKTNIISCIGSYKYLGLNKNQIFNELIKEIEIENVTSKKYTINTNMPYIRT